MARALILIFGLAVAGCQTAPAGDFCDVARAIRLSPATVAALSDSDVEAVLAHNQKGAAMCGWKP